MLVKLNIAIGDVGNYFRSHLRHLLAFLALESVCHEPLAYEFLGELFLALAASESLLVAFGIEIS